MGGDIVASLTHVCMWTEHGWKRITAYEASKLYPLGSVSARSGFFMCELCGQYVSLTNGSIRERYFKHSRSEKNKDCPERTFAPGAMITYSEKDHDLPLRMKIISTSSIEFELGLLPVPATLLGKRKEGQIRIKPSGKNEFVYSYDRLNHEGITYVSVGNNPAEVYQLSATANDQRLLALFWPAKVDGVGSEGAIFDIKTGKKLPYDADVEVGKSYYLLRRGTLWEHFKTVTVRQKCCVHKGWETWYVHEICATTFNEEAARFFLNYHCRLTEEPVDIYPLWPSCVEAPYLIYHKDDEVNMFFRGDAQAKAYPYSPISESGSKSGKLLTIHCSGRQQLLSAGRSKILQYTYLWKSSLEQVGRIPEATVTTLTGENFAAGKLEILPDKGTLQIKTFFDGELVIEEPGKIEVHYHLSAEQSFLLDSIHFGQTIKIFQGLDIAWSCEFFKKKNIENTSARDEELFEELCSYRGNMIAFPHSFGALANKMDHYPKCQKWLYKSIKKGLISKGALRVLKSEFRGIK